MRTPVFENDLTRLPVVVRIATLSLRVGWAYDGKYGNSARYARQSGEAVHVSSFVFGLRLWY
jgi:uncharacterized protein involved in copper resistance